MSPSVASSDSFITVLNSSPFGCKFRTRACPSFPEKVPITRPSFHFVGSVLPTCMITMSSFYKFGVERIHFDWL